MSYLIFKDYGHSQSCKTKRFAVQNKSDQILGFIRWHGPWRQYVFFTLDETLFNPDCLREIAGFLEKITGDHKNGRHNQETR